jgi:hypothetical protein
MSVAAIGANQLKRLNRVEGGGPDLLDSDR